MACQCTPTTLCRTRPLWMQIRVRELPWTYRTITALPKLAPVRLTVPGHGLTAPWPVAVVGATGLRGLNSTAPDPERPMRLEPWRMATVVDADTLEINDLYLLNKGTYEPGTGELIYAPPADLAGKTITARLVSDRGEVVDLAAAATGDPGVLEVTAPVSALTAITGTTGTLTVSCCGEQVLCFDPVTFE